MDEIVELHAIVHGKVQGVGFRATTQFHANRLKLLGTVCNLSDGSVEIHIQGSRSSIDQLFDKLKSVEYSKEISTIEFNVTHTPKHYAGFRILSSSKE